MAEQHRIAASVIVPAHNEERSIGRLLDRLETTSGGPLEVIVVSNGSTDATAEVARQKNAVVIELAEASKRAAMIAGDRVARAYPRIYVDADVEIGRSDLELLAAAVSDGRALAAGPRREIVRGEAPWPVRWYLDVWELLPQVREGLFGRGVIALSRAGQERVRSLPPVMADDLVISELFETHERTVLAGAVVRIHPPRTSADLLARRIRISTGNTQADLHDLRGGHARTALRDVATLLSRRPSLLVKSVVFFSFAAAGRLRARALVRRGDFSSWRRDESSRV